MHEAALVGIQALHHERFAGFEHALGFGAGAAQQLGFGAGAVVITINAHTGGIFPLGLHDAVDEVLQVIQAVTVLANEEAGIRAGNHEQGAVLVGGNLDAEGVAQGGEDIGEDLGGEGDEAILRVHGSGKLLRVRFIPPRDPGSAADRGRG